MDEEVDHITSPDGTPSSSPQELTRDFRDGLVAVFPPDAPRGEIPAARILRLAEDFKSRVGVPVEIRNAVITGDLDLTGATFAHGLVIKDSEFRGRVKLSRATFEGGLDLRGSHFTRAADFRAARVAGYCDLTLSEFRRSCRFDDARFGGRVSAAGAPFHRATCRRADFGGLVAFTPASADVPTPTRFEGRVDFSDAHFAGPASFDGAQFGKGVSFRQARFDSSLSFRCYLGIAEAPAPGAPDTPGLCVTTFGGRLDFARASVEGLASFEGAQFEGPADFQRAQFNNTTGFSSYASGDGARLLSRTRFREEADFSVCRIGAGAAFLGVEFCKLANFERLSVGGHLLFKTLKSDAATLAATTFRAEARFLGARVSNNAEFDGAAFMGDANFDHFEVERNVYFRPAFQGEELWGYTEFFGRTDFIGAHIQGDAEFTGAWFWKKVRLESIHVEGNAFFDNFYAPLSSRPQRVLPVVFMKDVSLVSAHFKHRARFGGAVFHGRAGFGSVEFEGAALFEGAWFCDRADFTGSRFDQYADFRGGTFADYADFKSAQVNGAAFFERAAFLGPTSFLAADFKSLGFELREPPAGAAVFGGSLDLSGFTYELININESLLADIFSSMGEYNRQAFTQLEKVLRSIGQDDWADTTYLYRRERENEERAKRVAGDFRSIAPSGWRGPHDDHAIRRWLRGVGGMFFDLAQDAVGNYGIRPFTRLLAMSLAVLVFGAVMFWQDGAVVPREAGAGTSYVLRAGDGGELEAVPADAKAAHVLKLDGAGAKVLVPAEKAAEPVRLNFTQAIGVSFNQFIPIIPIPSGSKWKPSEKLIPLPFGWEFYYFSYAFYGTIHGLLGAVLVPLGVAALTGILHRREKPSK